MAATKTALSSSFHVTTDTKYIAIHDKILSLLDFEKIAFSILESWEGLRSFFTAKEQQFREVNILVAHWNSELPEAKTIKGLWGSIHGCMQDRDQELSNRDKKLHHNAFVANSYLLSRFFSLCDTEIKKEFQKALQVIQEVWPKDMTFQQARKRYAENTNQALSEQSKISFNLLERSLQFLDHHGGRLGKCLDYFNDLLYAVEDAEEGAGDEHIFNENLKDLHNLLSTYLEQEEPAQRESVEMTQSESKSNQPSKKRQL